MNNNRCVCCGVIIPEGRQVCPPCERGKRNKQVKREMKKFFREIKDGGYDVCNSDKLSQKTTN
jgi:hypothetical protein